MTSGLSHSCQLGRELSLLLHQTHRETAVAGRIVAAVFLGLVLLLLSAIINIAKGAPTAGWSPMWISWAVVAAIVIVVASGAATLRAVSGALCSLCFVAGIMLLAALPWYSRAAETVPQSTAELAQSLGLSPPVGAAVGGAIVSGAMGIAAVIVTIAFLGASYFLLRHRDQHAH
jgi:hypothetical protein